MSEAGVRGIDLLKMAGESISGWIPRWKTARATSEMSPNFRPILLGSRFGQEALSPVFASEPSAYLPSPSFRWW